ncbi:MAG: hypothetical protein DMG85_15325 [Acidobacteria bacterium]|nr:MAG: hypothetical protein DMG85_15325 [Acidobacteriota bacterium]
MDDRKLVLVPIVLVILFGATLLAQERLPYQDPKLPVEQRVTDLLKRMTLEEKIAQLEGSWQNRDNVKDPQALFVDEKRNFLPAQASRLLKNGLGEMSRPSEKRGPREMADFTNTLQKWMKENTRLGIPILFHEECLHGHAAPRGTSFPQAIALAWPRSSTWPVIRAGGAQKKPMVRILI